MKATSQQTRDHLKIAESIISGWGENYSVTYEMINGVQKITFSSIDPVASKIETVKTDDEGVDRIDEAIKGIRAKLGTKPVKLDAPDVLPVPKKVAKKAAAKKTDESPLSEAVKSIREKFSKKPSAVKEKKPAKPRKRAKGTLSDESIPEGTIVGGVYKEEAHFFRKVETECNSNGAPARYAYLKVWPHTYPDGSFQWTSLDPCDGVSAHSFNTLSGAAKFACGGKPINGFRFFRLNWEGFKRGDDLCRIDNPTEVKALSKVWDDFAPLEVLSEEDLRAKLDGIRAKKKAAREAKKAKK